MQIDLKLGDCLEVMKSIPDNSIDLIVTDPPYRIVSNGFKARGGFLGQRKVISDIENIKDGFDFRVLDEFERVLKSWNLYVYCNKDLLFDLIVYFKNKNVFIDVLIEQISNPTPFCNNTYLNNIDYVLFIRESGVCVGGTYHTKTKVRQKNTNKTDKALYNHPTPKYVNIINDYIINSSVENDAVLDPFMGSGSTGVACINTNRNFIGIELDENYFNIAKERIENASK